MSEPVAATIYATQLAALQEGYPLWDPSPGTQPAVEIADVGYVEYGAWTRLFNASKPYGDPVNKFGTPYGYQPLDVGEPRERSCLPAKVPIRSENVEQRGVDIAISGGPGVPVQSGGGFSFKCSKEQGAVLLLGDDAERRDAFRKEDFARLIIQQGASWLSFANDIHGRGIMLDDLVLVTGCDKTSSWACAAFSKESSEAGVSFNIGQPGIAEGSISMSWAWKNCSSVATRSGSSRSIATTPPPMDGAFSSSVASRNSIDGEGDVYMTDAQTQNHGKALPCIRDQCVFLRGYKICDRKTWSARRLLRRKRKYDGFEHVLYKRRDDTEDPGSGPSPRPGFRSDQGTSQESQSSFHSKGGSSTTGNTSSASGGHYEEDSGASSDASDGIGSESFDSGIDDDLHFRMLLGQHKEPTLLHIVLDYILENSATELAMVHDDDLIGLLQQAVLSEDFERQIHDISPKIYVVDKVGMLETTYKVSLLSCTDIRNTYTSDVSSSTSNKISKPIHASAARDLDLKSRLKSPVPRVPSPDELVTRLRDKDEVIMRLLLSMVAPPHTLQYPSDSSAMSVLSSKNELLLLPPYPVWNIFTPKADIERLTAAWINKARKRVEEWVSEKSKPRLLEESALSSAVPEILRTGIVTLREVHLLFHIFFDKINTFFTICDPVLHTPGLLLRTSPFLFTTICAIASRHHPTRPGLYPRLLRAAQEAAGSALNAPKSVETCQAFLLLGGYHPQMQSFFEDRTFLFVGLAIRIAISLKIHLPQYLAVDADEISVRAALNRTRVWLTCVCCDRTVSTQLGKPATIDQAGTVPCDLALWWRSSPYSNPRDIHLCAYASLLNVVSGFRNAVACLTEGAVDDVPKNQYLDLALVKRYVNEISAVGTIWTHRFAENSTLRPHPATTWHDNVWPFLVSYEKLVALSIGHREGMRQGLRQNNPFSDQCVDTACDILTHVTETLARLGYLRYCVDAHFVFMGFAAAFLIKILRPRFTFMMRPGHADLIVVLVQRLIDLLGSDAVAIDNRHTPRVYARFLATSLTQHQARMAGRRAVPKTVPPTPHSLTATGSPSSPVSARIC